MNKIVSRIFILFAAVLFSAVTESPLKAAPKCLVVIDAGHGGDNTGVAVSRKIFEKDITLSLANLIKEKLKDKQNISVSLTRTEDNNIIHNERIQIANKISPNLFISLHVNAGFDKKATGYEIYFSGFKKPSSGDDSGEIVKDMIENEFLNASVRFAQIAQKNIEKVFPREGRGLREAPHIVLEGLKAPGVVVEIGFATNIENKKKITNGKTLQSLADEIVRSIQEYGATL